MSGSLGRTVWHDPASRNFPADTVPLKSAAWTHRGDILNQLDLGGCTGFALTDLLNCDPYFGPVSSANGDRPLDDRDGIGFYAIATTIDPFQGRWPMEDTGSSGLAVCKAAKKTGAIRGYSHAFGVDHALGALSAGPVLIGIPWFEGMDEPTPTGQVEISGNIRGGHEVCLNEIMVGLDVVWAINSWGPDWGREGCFQLTFEQLGELLDQQGDCTVPHL